MAKRSGSRSWGRCLRKNPERLTNAGTYLYIYEREAPAGSTATACAFAVDDVAATVYALRERGVTFEEYDIPEMGLKTVDGVATQGPMQSAFFYDPFGNILAVDNSTHVLESLG